MCVYGRKAVTDRTVRSFFEKFRSGDMTLKDEPKVGRSSEFQNDVLDIIVVENQISTTRELVEILQTSHSTITCYLHRLGKTSKLGHWILHHLNEQNKTDCHSN